MLNNFIFGRRGNIRIAGAPAVFLAAKFSDSSVNKPRIWIENPVICTICPGSPTKANLYKKAEVPYDSREL